MPVRVSISEATAVDDWRSRLTQFLHSQLPAADFVEIAAVRSMPAGASNDTAALDLEIGCDGEEWTLPVVLRPQREYGILAPYDIHRQFRVMRALSQTEVPVPAVLWHCDDLSVLGTPFYFMQRVRGETLPLLWYGGRSPRLLAAATALATVHAVDWRAAGLHFLLPAAGQAPSIQSPNAEREADEAVNYAEREADEAVNYAEREADEAFSFPKIQNEMSAWRVRAASSPIAGASWFIALAGYLVENEPADARPALLHGDPNPGNYLFRGDSVAAVLDWELAAIGDPRSDLGFYAALSTTFGGMPGHRGSSVLSDAYQSVTGIHLTNLEYYEAFGLYRMAALLASSRGAFSYYGMDAISRRLAELLGPRWAG